MSWNCHNYLPPIGGWGSCFNLMLMLEVIVIICRAWYNESIFLNGVVNILRWSISVMETDNRSQSLYISAFSK
jgi:hypothetical protein